jgi:hypothetical protein
MVRLTQRYIKIDDIALDCQVSGRSFRDTHQVLFDLGFPEMESDPSLMGGGLSRLT